MTPRAYGVCPRCGRTVPGRAIGPGPRPARTWVALSPHVREVIPGRHGQPCVTRGEYVRTPRVPPPLASE